MDALSPDSARLGADAVPTLQRLAARDWACDVYLAGSAALACYLGHRPVRGLDLMSAFNRLRSPDRRDLLEDLISFDPGARVETARDGFLSMRLSSGVAVRWFYYPYPLVSPEAEVEELAVAAPIDLALMKLGAIISRGTRRDFVDLYLLCRHLSLESVLERSGEKFGHVSDFPLQALKGVCDLEQAEDEPMPRLSIEVRWSEVERWVTNDVRHLARQLVGLEAGNDAGGRPP